MVIRFLHSLEYLVNIKLLQNSERNAHSIPIPSRVNTNIRL